MELMTLYTHTGGQIVNENPFMPDFKYSEDPLIHGWRRAKNWGSNLPFREWEGVVTNDANDIVEINLYENNLMYEIPFGVFRALPHLTRFDACFNNFSASPPGLPLGSAIGDEIEQLKHTAITELQLSGNKFSGFIPSSIGSLTALEKLQISYSKLTGSIPESITRLKQLTHLDLSENKLTGTLPKGWRNLTKLRVVYLNHNSELKVSERSLRAKLPNVQWVNL
jgi:Leucine-rich repeat (LRR) protein